MPYTEKLKVLDRLIAEARARRDHEDDESIE
jgi:hypothetical protein